MHKDPRGHGSHDSDMQASEGQLARGEVNRKVTIGLEPEVRS